MFALENRHNYTGYTFKQTEYTFCQLIFIGVQSLYNVVLISAV